MIMRYEKEDLQQALNTLRRGGVILYPTDTVWGIGCDATNEEAVQRIFAIKEREDAKSMLCLLDAPGKLQGYVTVPDVAWDLLDCATPEEGYEPRPMTIIYPDAKGVAPSLIAEDGSLGIRLTEEPFSKALCAGLKRPLVSTSANISGEPAARFFKEIDARIIDAVDYVCLFRRTDNTPKQPSSIVKVGIAGQIQVIRP